MSLTPIYADSDHYGKMQLSSVDNNGHRLWRIGQWHCKIMDIAGQDKKRTLFMTYLAPNSSSWTYTEEPRLWLGPRFYPLIFSAPGFIILFALFFLTAAVRFHFSGLKGVLLPKSSAIFAPPPPFPYLRYFGGRGIIFQLGWRLQIGKAALALSRWAPDSSLINCTLSKKWWLGQDNRQDR